MTDDGILKYFACTGPKKNKFLRLFRIPRIGYRCYIKEKDKKGKTYIKFIGYEDDTWTEDVSKKEASIWNDFEELREEIEYQFDDGLEDGTIEYVKIEPCLCYIDPWWKKWHKNWFEYWKSGIDNIFSWRIPDYQRMKSYLVGEYGKWKTFWMNPIWDLVLPHRWIKNRFVQLFSIIRDSTYTKEDI